MYQNCYGTPAVPVNPWSPIPPQNQSPVIPSNFKFIDRPEDIQPGNIPMNGDLGVFPLRDRSGIITKQWKSDGSIETIKYVPEVHIETPTEPIADPVLERLDKLIEIMTPKPAPKARKEAMG